MTTPKIQKLCVECGKPFEVSRQWQSKLTCSTLCRNKRSKHGAENERRCLRCDTLLPNAHAFSSGNQLYCSLECKAPLPACDDGAPCIHCGRLFKYVRKRKFCSAACRVEHFKMRHDDDGEEIPVVDIDEAPRRLAVAKLFDKFECNGAFNHFTPPTWMNPADRRHWR